MPNPRIATSIFCDDIRQEIGNKLSLMGIYAEEIIFPAPPPAPLHICAVVWVTSDIDDPPQQLVIRVQLQPEGTELLRIIAGRPTMAATPPANATRMTVITIFRLPPTEITQPGYLEMLVDTEREKDIRAGRLLVRFPSPPQEDS